MDSGDSDSGRIQAVTILLGCGATGRLPLLLPTLPWLSCLSLLLSGCGGRDLGCLLAWLVPWPWPVAPLCSLGLGIIRGVGGGALEGNACVSCLCATNKKCFRFV